MAILLLIFSFLVRLFGCANTGSNLYFWIAIIPIVISKTLGGHARRVYVGGFSPAANEQVVATLFSQVMTAVGGNTAGPVDAVVNVYVNHEKFAFVEMRSFEEASNTMSLDGMIFELPRSLCYRYCVRCGVKMGDNTLTVRRANQGITQHQPEQESAWTNVVIPRPIPSGEPVAGLGKINERLKEALKYLKDFKWNRVEEPKEFTLELFFVAYCTEEQRDCRLRDNKQEKRARKYLKDIKWNKVKEPKRFTVDLFFDQNSYYQNTVFTKTHHMIDKYKLISRRSLGMI
ncbi:unnamed protein product, partial [Brassica oleracea]